MIKELFLTMCLLQGIISADDTPQGAVGLRQSYITHTVQKVYANSPAEYAGVKAGDKVICIIDEKGRKDLIGPPGSLVHVYVRRGEKILDFYIRRVCESAIDRRGRSLGKLYTDKLPESKPCPQSTSPSSPLLPAT